MSNDRERIMKHREEVLGTLADANPVWVCLKDILDESKEQSIGTVTREDISSEQRAYCAGYLACAVDAFQEINRLRTAHLNEDPTSPD